MQHSRVGWRARVPCASSRRACASELRASCERWWLALFQQLVKPIKLQGSTGRLPPALWLPSALWALRLKRRRRRGDPVCPTLGCHSPPTFGLAFLFASIPLSDHGQTHQMLALLQREAPNRRMASERGTDHPKPMQACRSRGHGCLASAPCRRACLHAGIANGLGVTKGGGGEHTGDAGRKPRRHGGAADAFIYPTQSFMGWGTW